MDATSEGFNTSEPPFTGTPSITNKGSLLAEIERFPRIRIIGVSFSPPPATITPAALPRKASCILVGAVAIKFSAFT